MIPELLREFDLISLKCTIDAEFSIALSDTITHWVLLFDNNRQELKVMMANNTSAYDAHVPTAKNRKATQQEEWERSQSSAMHDVTASVIAKQKLDIWESAGRPYLSESLISYLNSALSGRTANANVTMTKM